MVVVAMSHGEVSRFDTLIRASRSEADLSCAVAIDCIGCTLPSFDMES